jgi:TRAP-type C4-dicarboxylate transport system permease small subunit
MKIASIVGILLVVIGVIGIVYGGFTYTAKQTTVQVGTFQVTAKEKKTIPISSVAGAVLVVGGVIVMVVGGGIKR